MIFPIFTPFTPEDLMVVQFFLLILIFLLLSAIYGLLGVIHQQKIWIDKYNQAIAAGKNSGQAEALIYKPQSMGKSGSLTARFSHLQK